MTRRRKRRGPSLDTLVRAPSMLGIWIDERLPRDRMRELPYTRSVEVAASFIGRHEVQIASAIGVARDRFGDDAELDDVFEILRAPVVAFVADHLRCSLLDRPRPPW